MINKECQRKIDIAILITKVFHVGRITRDKDNYFIVSRKLVEQGVITVLIFCGAQNSPNYENQKLA